MRKQHAALINEPCPCKSLQVAEWPPRPVVLSLFILLLLLFAAFARRGYCFLSCTTSLTCVKWSGKMQRWTKTSRAGNEGIRGGKMWVIKGEKRVSGLVLWLNRGYVGVRERAGWERPGSESCGHAVWNPFASLSESPRDSRLVSLKALKTTQKGPVPGSEINSEIALGLFLNWMQSAKLWAIISRFSPPLISPSSTWCQSPFVSITKGFSGIVLRRRRSRKEIFAM